MARTRSSSGTVRVVNECKWRTARDFDKGVVGIIVLKTREVVMSAVSLAAHVELFGSSGYKRDFSRITDVFAPSTSGVTPLRIPGVSIGGIDRISATSARPDQRVNVRVPVARACGAPLYPGQVAFVSRGAGSVRASLDVPENAPAFVGTHVMSLEHLNELLAQPVHHVSLNGTSSLPFFKSTTAKSLFSVNATTGDLKRQQARVFDADAFFRPPGRNKVHPVRQYALDGVVCTPSDEGGIHSSPMCNVAVKGPAPVLTHRTTNDKMRPVAVAPYPQERVIPSNYFLKPVDVMAHVYVVLVAARVGDATTSKEWMFRYELVTSSNVQTDHAFKRFTSSIGFKRAAKVVLRVTQLGRVVDTNFGDPKAPSIVVSVNIRPYEATIRESVETNNANGARVLTSYTAPLNVWNTFSNRPERHGGTPVANKHAAHKAVILSPVSKSLLSAKNPGVVFSSAGPSQADLDRMQTALKKQIDDAAKETKNFVKDTQAEMLTKILDAVDPQKLASAFNISIVSQFLGNDQFLELLSDAISTTILKIDDITEAVSNEKSVPYTIDRIVFGDLPGSTQDALSNIVYHSIAKYAEKQAGHLLQLVEKLQSNPGQLTQEGQVGDQLPILQRKIDALKSIYYDGMLLLEDPPSSGDDA